MAGAPSLAKSDTPALGPEELDRFASQIKASWELDDAPFAAGPAPTAADLALVAPSSANGPSDRLAAPTFAAAAATPPVSAGPAPAVAPPHAGPPAPAAAFAPSFPIAPMQERARVAPAVPSSSDLMTGSFAVPKKRTGLFVALGAVALVIIGGAVFALKGDEPKPVVAPPKVAETPRENSIPPPPTPEEVAEAPKKPAKAEGKPPRGAEKVAEKTAEKSAEKPAERPAERAPERRPPPVAAAREPRPPPAPTPPKATPAKPAGAPAGGIVRDVPF